jgi:hypothetical protein
VQDSAVFRDVDLFAAKYGIDAFAQPGFVGQLELRVSSVIRFFE